MNAAASVLLAFQARPAWDQGSGARARTSSGKFSAKRTALSYRQHFALRWSRFLHEHFESPEHVAHLFGVDGSTARKWWDGSHAPSGFAVAYAYERFPEEAASSLRGEP